MTDEKVEELREEVQELKEELERVKDRKTGEAKEREAGKIQDQIEDAAENSSFSRRKFMKMIGGGAVGLSAATVLPGVSGFTFKDDKSFKFGNMSSSQTNLEVATGGDLEMHGNDIRNVGGVHAAVLDTEEGVNISEGDRPTVITYGRDHEDSNGQIAPESTLIGIGTRSGFNTQTSGTTADKDKTRAVHVGYEAGKNTSYWGTTAVGWAALRNGVDAYRTTAIGLRSLENIDGRYNTSVGYKSAKDAGFDSGVVMGYQAGVNNTGDFAVGIGREALSDNTANRVTGVGYRAAAQNDGNYCTAVGMSALRGDGVASTGNYATAIGYDAGRDNTGDNAVLIGHEAGKTNSADGAVVIGSGTSVSVANGGRIGVDQLVFGGSRDTFVDADLNNEELTIELDETNSAFRLRGKDSTGTVQEATVAW